MVKRRMTNFFRNYSQFRTGKGAVNHIIEHDSTRVYFRSEGRRMINTILLSKLQSALKALFLKRTIIRKELEAYSSFSSALFGLVAIIFKDLAKVKIGSRGMRLTLRGVRFFFSGCCKAVKDLEIASEHGAEYVLMSYWWLRNKKNPFEHIKRLGLKVMLDSGAFSAWRKGVRLDVQDYAAFIIQHQDDLHSYITLDVIGDPEASEMNDRFLRGRGLHPVPVFPAAGDMNQLAALIEADHDYIAIGATVGLGQKIKQSLFEHIFTQFPDGRFHWLGGSSRLIVDYPWFSADSSTWLSGRKYGKILNDQFQTCQVLESMGAAEALGHNVSILSKLEFSVVEAAEAREEKRYTLGPVAA